MDFPLEPIPAPECPIDDTHHRLEECHEALVIQMSGLLRPETSGSILPIHFTHKLLYV